MDTEDRGEEGAGEEEAEVGQTADEEEEAARKEDEEKVGEEGREHHQ